LNSPFTTAVPAKSGAGRRTKALDILRWRKYQQQQQQQQQQRQQQQSQLSFDRQTRMTRNQIMRHGTKGEAGLPGNSNIDQDHQTTTTASEHWQWRGE
jgi:hypothetical protein